ncbi:NUDIX domain-containing protein [Streptomyces montanisoli]|uniref:NUDIX domain-containing protein n=1 Tax=Streptomyces montanisoli TaxID=2798581 RepID=A0A940RZ18_9ACTN|nr:NUDIX domain-containing protein [Streptomyces montanisoli]
MALGDAPEDEILTVVDEDDHVIGRAPRGEVYAKGLRHRATAILVRDAGGRMFVHRRTATKLAFPSLYDVFVGGVVGAGESYDDCALREAGEELGVAGLPRPEPLFRYLFELPGGRGAWWTAVYELRCESTVHPQVEEVAWHAFLPAGELDARLRGEVPPGGAGTAVPWEFVPDGRATYERYLRFAQGRA